MDTIRFIFVAILFTTSATAQYCSQAGRYSTAKFFSKTEIDSLKNSRYGTAMGVRGTPQELFIDFFFPKSTARSIKALMTAYGSQEKWNEFIPTLGAKLELLDASGNSFTHTFSITALFNNWGAISLIAIKPEELLPMISFHGELDKILSIDISPYTDFNSKKFKTC
jgi:hypothetical protein